MSQRVKNPRAVQETQVQSLGQEDPLQEEVPTNSSILAWKISWTEEPGGLQSKGLQRAGHDWVWAQTVLIKRRHKQAERQGKMKAKIWVMHLQPWFTEDGQQRAQS